MEFGLLNREDEWRHSPTKAPRSPDCYPQLSQYRKYLRNAKPYVCEIKLLTRFSFLNSEVQMAG